jgi:hypothetical protein
MIYYVFILECSQSLEKTWYYIGHIKSDSSKISIKRVCKKIQDLQGWKYDLVHLIPFKSEDDAKARMWQLRKYTPEMVVQIIETGCDE